MEKIISLTSAPEAITDPHRYQGAEVTRRSPEEQEEAILAHQYRIDLARNHGRLRPSGWETMPLRQRFMYEPGYEKTPRGLKLGEGLGYDSCPSRIARKEAAAKRMAERASKRL